MAKKPDSYEELDTTLQDENANWYNSNLIYDLWQKGYPKEIFLEVPNTTKYLWMVYPMHTLATNRIISTVISRKTSKRNMLHDLKDMWQIGGLKVLYAGFVPSMLYLASGTLS